MSKTLAFLRIVGALIIALLVVDSRGAFAVEPPTEGISTTSAATLTLTGVTLPVSSQQITAPSMIDESNLQDNACSSTPSTFGTLETAPVTQLGAISDVALANSSLDALPSAFGQRSTLAGITNEQEAAVNPARQRVPGLSQTTSVTTSHADAVLPERSPADNAISMKVSCTLTSSTTLTSFSVPHPVESMVTAK